MARNRNNQASQAPDHETTPQGAPPQENAPPNGDQTGTPPEPPAPQGVGPQQNDPDKDTDKGKQKADGVLYSVHHKTRYPVYRRAGIILRRQPEEVALTKEQVKVLSADKWVELKKVDKKGK